MKTVFFYLALLFCVSGIGHAQTKRALFLGNSYTAVNNLPQMVADVALSAGDTLIFDSNAPGGYTLEGHSTNETSLNKIKSGGWDYIILQEQSQRPSLPIEQVMEDVFPYARILDSVFNAFNPCGETVFYMTWGRKNGDASNCDIWPPVCTYEGMDSLLNLRYRMLADSNQAILSPVGAVWHYIRHNYTSIELYMADESHPSVAGSYAAACCFYSSLFRKDPTLVTFNPSLLPADAANIRTAAKLIVYDSLMNWHIGEYDPVADFTYEVSGNYQVDFTNSSENAETYLWDFGDGDTSAMVNPQHTYDNPGFYDVKLTAVYCQYLDSIVQTIYLNFTGKIDALFEQDVSWKIFPSPVNTILTVESVSTYDCNYKIFNGNGIEIQSGDLSGFVKQVPISSLPKGIYILQLIEETQSLGIQKFIRK